MIRKNSCNTQFSQYDGRPAFHASQCRNRMNINPCWNDFKRKEDCCRRRPQFSFLQLVCASFVVTLIFCDKIRRTPAAGHKLRHLEPSTSDSVGVLFKPPDPHVVPSNETSFKVANGHVSISSLAVNQQNERNYRSLEASSVEDQEEAISAYISFFLCSLLCAVALQWLVSHVTVYNIPVSIIWFIFGMVISLGVEYFSASAGKGTWRKRPLCQAFAAYSV